MSSGRQVTETRDPGNGEPAPPTAELLATIRAMDQFSRGLWYVFLGSAILLGCAAVFLLGPRWVPGLLRFASLALVGVLAAIWLVFEGKHKCWSAAVPIDGQQYLYWSCGFDFALIVARMVRRAVGRGPLMALIEATLGLLSYWFLVAFMLRLANTIRDGFAAFLCRVTSWSLLFGLISIVSSVAWRWCDPENRTAALLGLVALLSLVIGAVTFLVLALSLSLSLRRFSDYLKIVVVNELRQEQPGT